MLHDLDCPGPELGCTCTVLIPVKCRWCIAGTPIDGMYHRLPDHGDGSNVLVRCPNAELVPGPFR